MKTSVRPRLLNVSSGAGVASTVQSCAASLKTVHCANPFRRTLKSTICLQLTTMFCAALLTAWHRNIHYVVQPVALRRGSTMIVAMHVVTAVVWSAGIDARAAPTIAVSGLTLSGADFGCIGQRRKHTGWIVCRKTGAHRHWCCLLYTSDAADE